MWTCHNCENTISDDAHVCPVCGATLPDVSSIAWDNQKGKDPSKGGIAKVCWEGTNAESIFAVYGGETFYLTGKNEASFKVPADEQNGIIYFCSSAGYIEYHFTLGSCEPVIKIFRIYNTLRPYKPFRIGDLATVEWEVANGTATVASDVFEPVISSAKIGSKCFIVSEEETDVDITVIRTGYTSAMAELTVKATQIEKPSITWKVKQGTRTNTKKFVCGEPVLIEYEATNCHHVAIGSSTNLPPKGTVYVPGSGYARPGEYKIRISAYTNDVSEEMYNFYAHGMILTKEDSDLLENLFGVHYEETYTIVEPKAEIRFNLFSESDLAELKEGDIVRVDWTPKNVYRYQMMDGVSGLYYAGYKDADGVNVSETDGTWFEPSTYTSDDVTIRVRGGKNVISIFAKNKSGDVECYKYEFEAKQKLSSRLKTWLKRDKTEE